MTSSIAFRPALALLLAASLSACSGDDGAMETARRWASVDSSGRLGLSEGAGADAVVSPVRVEVLDPHALWDARDGLSAPVAAAQEALADLVGEFEGPTTDEPAGGAGGPAADALAPPPQAAEAPRMVQLGAYGSRSAAQAAWQRLRSGGSGDALKGLEPVLEDVRVDARNLVRLKVRTTPANAGAVCAAAGIDDPWCRRPS